VKSSFDQAIATNGLKMAAMATNEEKKEMYGLYKQALQGDAAGERPGMLDFVGRAKFDSWDALRGMPQEDAMRAYTERSYDIAGNTPPGAVNVAASDSDEEPLLSHADLRETARTFVDREINPYVDAWEKEGIFPAKELFKKMGDAGLLGLTKPVENGGLGLDYTYSVVLAEELGNINCGGVPMAIGVQTDMSTPALAKFGSPELRAKFLTPSISGDYVACLGVSEVGAGSDVAGLKTTAVVDGDDYVINGGKMWTTNGTQADWCCLLVNTEGGEPPHGNKTMIAMPMDLPGVSFAPRFDKLGMRSSDTTQLTLENVRVPRSHVIGEVGRGFSYQMVQFQEERLWAGANALTGFQRIIDQTVEYATDRRAFGKPIIANQAVRFRLAELQTELELLRALTWNAAERVAKGEDVTMLASMVKLKAGRLGREITDSCLQYWGGMGFMSETPISRAYRDVRLASIGGGADEIMLEIIGKLRGYSTK
jgi:citronellyl-CoA dehydrogenase